MNDIRRCAIYMYTISKTARPVNTQAPKFSPSPGSDIPNRFPAISFRCQNYFALHSRRGLVWSVRREICLILRVQVPPGNGRFAQ